MTLKIIAIILAVVSVCFSFYAVLLMRSTALMLRKRQSVVMRKHAESESLGRTQATTSKELRLFGESHSSMLNDFEKQESSGAFTQCKKQPLS